MLFFALRVKSMAENESGIAEIHHARFLDKQGIRPREKNPCALLIYTNILWVELLNKLSIEKFQFSTILGLFNHAHRAYNFDL